MAFRLANRDPQGCAPRQSLRHCWLHPHVLDYDPIVILALAIRISLSAPAFAGGFRRLRDQPCWPRPGSCPAVARAIGTASPCIPLGLLVLLAFLRFSHLRRAVLDRRSVGERQRMIPIRGTTGPKLRPPAGNRARCEPLVFSGVVGQYLPRGLQCGRSFLGPFSILGTCDASASASLFWPPLQDEKTID